MAEIEKMKEALTVFSYIYMITLAPAMILRLILFMSRTIESYLLLPLMVFSFAYGIVNVIRMMTQCPKVDAR
jgi:membrane-associated HD superfamily phosphohydrolase